MDDGVRGVTRERRCVGKEFMIREWEKERAAWEIVYLGKEGPGKDSTAETTRRDDASNLWARALSTPIRTTTVPVPPYRGCHGLNLNLWAGAPKLVSVASGAYSWLA